MRREIPKWWARKRSYPCHRNTTNSWRSLSRSLEPDDVKKLLRKRFTPMDKCLILLLLRTGMRICELLALKVKDINLNERTIIIHKGAKNGRGRILYISDDLHRALKRWMQGRDPKKSHLLYAQGRDKMSYETARTRFNKCLKKASIISKGYKLHFLRHTFASELLSAGMPLESLQVLMGHSHIEVTRRYARLTDKAMEQDYFRAMKTVEEGGINGSYRS
jgi:integrase/recombinase XerD